MKDKICAMIRQTWYETAKRNLQPAERLRFYELCLEYEFFGTEPDPDAPFSSRLLFDMVRNDIDQDKAKAVERAERNRRNGRNGGRPKVTEVNSENENPKNPVGFSETLYTNTSTHTSTQHNNDSVQENEDSHMFFDVCLMFFEKGCADPVAEGETFWNYYASLGWKTKGGGEIVDKMALAKAWRLSNCSKLAMRKRVDFAKAMHLANPVETVLLSDFIEMSKDLTTKKVTISFVNRETAMLFDNKYLKSIWSRWMPFDEDGKPFSLDYRVQQVPM